MSDETAEERFARRTRGASYRRLKGEMQNGDPLTLPTTKEQLDELERSRMDFLNVPCGRCGGKHAGRCDE